MSGQCESWTARGALLCTLMLVLTAALALQLGLPPLKVDPSPTIELHLARADFVLAWFSTVISGLAVVAGVWGIYGARNVPAPRGWRPAAPTSAQLRRGITQVEPPEGEAP